MSNTRSPMGIWFVILRTLLGVFIAFSGLSRLLTLGSWSLQGTWLHSITGGSSLLLHALSLLAIFAGTLLIVGFRTANVAVALLIVFAAVLGWYWFGPRERDVPCGCFGHADMGNFVDARWFLMFRDVVFLAGLAWLYLVARSKRAGSPAAGRG